MTGRIIGTNFLLKWPNWHFRRGQCGGIAVTADELECPSDTGLTWMYLDSSWLYAGEGLLINCYNSTCSLDSPCPNGQGDCDNDSHCAGLLVCGSDNCESGPRGLDCCTSKCLNDSDCLNQECNTDIQQCRLDSHSTDWSKCSQDSPCNKGVGDCDTHDDCEGVLLCGFDNCLGGPTYLDCCTGRSIMKKIMCKISLYQRNIFFRVECLNEFIWIFWH